MSNEKQAAIEEIIILAEKHSIHIDDISARLTHTTSSTKQSNILKTLFGYMGGIFVFSGIGLLVGMMWGEMSSSQHVIVTLGTGIIAFIIGIIAHKDERYTKAATPLLLVSGLMQPMGMFVFLDEYYPNGGDPQLAAILIFAVMVVQQSIAFTILKRPSLLFLVLIFWSGFLDVLMGRLYIIDEQFSGLTIGLSLLLITYSIDKTSSRSIVPFWYFISASLFLVSLWSLLEGSMFDIIYLAVNGFFIYLSIRLASRTLLFVSVIGLMSYLSYFTYEYFANIIGWPIALILMGLAMIGLSSYAVKLGQKIRNSQQKG